MKQQCKEYSYFKRYNRFSSGGYMSPISKGTAKGLIKRMDGKIKKETYRTPGECRIVELSNRNQIFISID
jgi:hypothetical protein